MGHRVSAELMQLVVETIAGCTHAVKHHNDQNWRTHNDVWIDGFRIAGTRADVDDALARSLRIATTINATFKTPPSISTDYDFIGVRFKHAPTGGSVRVADKTIKKLPQTIRHAESATSLESLVARLIFAAGVLRIPLAQHYFALKWVNRKVNQLNRGVLQPDEIIAIPHAARRSLAAWLSQARATLTLPGTKSCTSLAVEKR
jgi:hypothetical protein